MKSTQAESLQYRTQTSTGESVFSAHLVIRTSIILILGLALISWYYVIAIDGLNLGTILSKSNMSNASDFLSELLGASTESPAFYSTQAWYDALLLSLRTIQMSILAIGMAATGMLVTVIPGARTAADGRLTLKKTVIGRIAYGIIRISYVLARGIPELFWAMFIILILQPGILPGAVALAVHNFGILGKLCSEVVEDLDLRPVRALRSSGASLYQILVYGIIPEVTPKFLTYLLYRWEAIIRATIVVGFVSAGGLGMKFKLSMSWFHYTEVTLLLLCYFIIVTLVDIASGVLRGIAKL